MPKKKVAPPTSAESVLITAAKTIGKAAGKAAGKVASVVTAVTHGSTPPARKARPQRSGKSTGAPVRKGTQSTRVKKVAARKPANPKKKAIRKRSSKQSQ